MILARSTEISLLLAHSIYSHGSSFVYIYPNELMQMVCWTAGENLHVTDRSVRHAVITNSNFATCNILKAQSSPVTKDLHLMSSCVDL